MRATTIFRKLLALSKTVVEGVRFENGVLRVTVKPRWQVPRCGECGKKRPGYDQKKARTWRHLSLGKVRILLEYAPRRVDCKRCGGVRVEEVPWARQNSTFTRDFEELTAHLARYTDKTTVSELMGIAWLTVGSIVDRLVTERWDADRLSRLKRIGVDEFSYRKRYRYLTNIIDHDTGQVVWVSHGQGSEALVEFFDAIGKDVCEQIELVTMDMSAGYQKAVRDRLPNAEIVFDRFHVQGIVKDALDEVRLIEMRDQRQTPEGRLLFDSRWALVKRPWRLDPKEDDKLASIQETNRTLYRAYLLYQAFAESLDLAEPSHAESALRSWMSWASRSHLAPFVRAARTVRKHLDGILRYLSADRPTNALVEGTNNRIRTVARRAYGFHSPTALMSMIFLCCGGIELNPPLPG